MNEVTDRARQRGLSLLDLGRAREAEEQFRTALAAEPDDAMLLTLLAEAQLRQERYEQARESSRAALAAAPEHIWAHSILAAALSGLKKHAEALESVRRGIALAPEIAGLHLQEGYVLLALERPADAMGSVSTARELDPEDADGAVLLARVLYELDRYDDAGAAIDEALRLDPENTDAHRMQGALALRRGGGKPAVAAHRTALRLDPTNAHTREGLAVALKSRNPLYGLLLRYSTWLDSVPKGVRVGVLLLPFILTRLLRPYEGQTWATVLLIVVVAFVLLTWTLEPLMNCVLLLSKDRHLLARPARLATYGFLAFAGGAVACVVYGLANGPAQLLPLAFGLGVWAMVVGSAHTVRADWHKGLVAAGAAAGALAAFATVATIAGLSGAATAVLVLLLSGIAALWVTAFA